MEFKVTILGSSSATPLADRFPTSQLLEHKSKFFLLDCGEGTQIQLRRLKIKFQRISKIFITHLHGDHCFGLIGLLSSYQLLNRQQPLDIYCPKGMKEIIDVQLHHSKTNLVFPLRYHFHEETDKTLWESDDLIIEKVRLNHRIPTWGFLFKEKDQGRRLNDNVVKELGIPYGEIAGIRKGLDFKSIADKVYKNEDITHAGPPLKSYAFITDNRIKEGLVEELAGITTLYHEATFLESLKDRAVKTKHATTSEVAILASKLGVKKLMVGHYSSRYKAKDLHRFQEEIQRDFKNVCLVKDGETIKVE